MRPLVAIVCSLLVTVSGTALAAPQGNHWDLARAVIRHRDQVAAAHIVAMFDGTAAEAARAARIMRIIGVGSPSAFMSLFERGDFDEEARRLIVADIAGMPAASEARARLLDAIGRAESVAQQQR